MFSNKINYKLVNLTVLMLLLYISFSNIGVWWGIFCKIISLLAPFIIAFAFSYALTPFVKFLERRGIRHGLAVFVVVISLVLIVSGLFAVTLPLLYDQISLFAKFLIKSLQNFSLKFDINFGKTEIKIADYLNDIVNEIGNLASSTTIGILSASIGFISKFIVGFVGFIYFLADIDKIKKRFKELLLAINEKTFLYVKTLDQEIGHYIKGLGIFMIIQLIEYSFLYFIIGHPNWLILGILACLTTVIPYFGGLITNLIALVTASVISTPLAIATLIICLIFPQLDGYVISPKVYGKTNNINPLITIMVVSVGGTLAGAVGIVIALPVYLFVRSTYLFYKKDLKKGMKKIQKAI